MSQIHAIDASRFTKPPVPPDPGAAPLLQWIDIGNLVVDHSYQREIRGTGKVNVRKIAADFRWSCFAPVVVSPISGGKFAIVDGQHRTTAAARIGLKCVPCQVIVVTAAEQAMAFKEINGATTTMSRQAIHAAAVMAGDPDALALEAVAALGEVKILRYPVQASKQETGGETMAVACLETCLRQYGRDTLVTALQCITQTSNNVPGIVVSSVIKALCVVLNDNIAWRDSGSKLLEAFDEIDIEQLLEQSRLQAKPKGTSISAALAARISGTLKETMSPRQVEAPKRVKSESAA